MPGRSTIPDPRSIPDLVAWYDAFDLASITKDGSNLVSQWSDKGPNGYHATHATSGNRPTYAATGLNSRPTITYVALKALTYEGGNAVGRNVSGVTLFSVAVTTDKTAVQRYAMASTVTTAQRCSLSINETSGVTGTGDYSGGGRRLNADGFVAIKGGTITNNTPFIQSNVFDYANSDLFLYGSGALVASETSFQTSGLSQDLDSPTLAVGSTGLAGANSLLGSLSELIIYNRALSTAERRRVEWYLSLKWGVNVA